MSSSPPRSTRNSESSRSPGNAPILVEELRDVSPQVCGARARRRHDRLEAVEDLHEPPSQDPCFVDVAGVEVHLAATRLLDRELNLEADAIEDRHRRAPDLRRERVRETRDEEPVRHGGQE